LAEETMLPTAILDKKTQQRNAPQGFTVFITQIILLLILIILIIVIIIIFIT
jgi:hypothetical protein